MTLTKARELWEKDNPEADWEALSDAERTEILTAAVLKERARRR